MIDSGFASTSRISPRATPPQPLDGAGIEDWMLDPSIAFLNHGCFGARLRSVCAVQQRYRDRFEAEPVQTLHVQRDGEVERARAAVGAFIGAQPGNLGFVTNATEGVNAVLRSLALEPDHELLTINHVYNAVRMTMHHAARRAGAAAIEVRLSVPVDSSLEVTDAIAAAVTKRTRLVIIDHVTSPTALMLPVRDIVRRCTELGVDVCIDGAHAPGMVELDIESIGAAYYAGNLHKWTCAPVGAGFLWVRPDRQAGIHAQTISHFLDEGFPHSFRWQGTRDISPWLAAADSIHHMEERYGWANARRHNHELAVWAEAMLCEKWGVEALSPMDGSMLGSMATLPLPGGGAAQSRYESAEALQRVLYAEHGFEVPIVEWDDAWWLRVSCQVYNTAEQYQRLGEVVAKLLQ